MLYKQVKSGKKNGKKKRCNEDDAEAHEIDEIIPRKIGQHWVCSP